MYLSYYDLKEEPFKLTPDPRFLHLAEPHRVVLKTLLQGVVGRKGFLVLTGPVGTGKTTMIHAMLYVLAKKLMPETKLLSALLVNPTLSRDEFLEAVLYEMELDCPPTKPRRLQVLQDALLKAQGVGGTAVLIIDEAHLLSLELLEEIRMLGNADTHREKLLQVILCGQPELRDLLATPRLAALRQRINSRCALRALSENETRAYIAERLHVAGLSGHSPFPGHVLEEIHRLSRGVPRLINLICSNSLSMGYEAQYREITSDLVQDAASTIELDPCPLPLDSAPISGFPARTVGDQINNS